MNPFLIYFLGSIVVSVAWTFLLWRANRLDRRSVGLAGAWAATLVLASIYQADAVPWLWNSVQIVILVWSGAMLLLVIAAVTGWNARLPLRLPLLSCAVLSLVVNFAASLHFLWLATVSAGGV